MTRLLPTAVLCASLTACSGLLLTNLALGHPAYQTDNYYDKIASYAVDGETAQHYDYCAHTESYNGTWEVDLGKQSFIDNVIIYNRQDDVPERLQEVQVYIGKTRDSYVLAAYQPGLAGSILTLQTSTNNCGQWLMITRKIPHEQLTLCEVQVMGYPLGVYFRRYTSAEGTGNALSTATRSSIVACSFMCFSAVDCASAQYNINTGLCSMFDSQSSASSLDEGNVFLLPVL